MSVRLGIVVSVVTGACLGAFWWFAPPLSEPPNTRRQRPILVAKNPTPVRKKAEPLGFPVLNAKDMKELPSLLPTTYFVADERRVSCRGTYGKRRFRGHERRRIRDPKGRVIATVCSRFFRVLMMEGTGFLRPKNGVAQVVNWAGRGRFITLKRCRYGRGIGRLCLLPFHTIAADLKAHRLGDVIYIPRLRGAKLPDQTRHSGLFVVLDTGGAFRGIGTRRVDLFVGTQTSSRNVFQKIGVHHRRPEKAYKLSGLSRRRALRFLKRQFPKLYTPLAE